jgi:hypothetical protein
MLKLAGRIIPRSGGYNIPQFAAGSVSKACFGVYTRDYAPLSSPIAALEYTPEHQKHDQAEIS